MFWPHWVTFLFHTIRPWFLGVTCLTSEATNARRLQFCTTLGKLYTVLCQVRNYNHVTCRLNCVLFMAFNGHKHSLLLRSFILFFHTFFTMFFPTVLKNIIRIMTYRSSCKHDDINTQSLKKLHYKQLLFLRDISRLCKCRHVFAVGRQHSDMCEAAMFITI
jgi:hypothetical protein